MTRLASAASLIMLFCFVDPAIAQQDTKAVLFACSWHQPGSPIDGQPVYIQRTSPFFVYPGSNNTSVISLNGTQQVPCKETPKVVADNINKSG